MTFDMNDAEPQKTSETIPDGTFAKVTMSLRPGGIDGESEIDRGLLKRSGTEGSDVLMLDAEFTVAETARDRPGQCWQGGDDRSRARPWLPPEQPQRGGRARHPALGDRNPRRPAVTGETMLFEAAKVVEERRQAYGDAAPLMAAVAQRWSITLGRPVTPAQVVLCLIDLKLARLGHDPTHADSIVDVAGYAAVLQEVAR